MTAQENSDLAVLKAHRARLEGTDLRRLFREDSKRFGVFSATCSDLLLDYSKNRIDASAMKALLALAADRGVAEARDAMFAGDAVNVTEGRAVLHVALRAQAGDRFVTGGVDVVPEVLAVLERLAAFAHDVHSGAIAGVGGPFTDVVNIGIGGSDLGPVMVARALSPYADRPRLHFVSNVDGAHIADTLKGLDPGRTLFLIASKTFTTVETMTNAATARRWLVDQLGEGAVGQHFAAMSTALPKVKAFGISEDRTFGFWDWVGGRYSVWSAIGLPVMIAIGPERFRDLLDGARAMDVHFRDTPFEANLPVILAVLGVWYRDVWGFPAHAVLPYAQRLERFPAYLQQLDMESNGKRVRLDGSPVEWPTGPLIWGEPGTNGQHAFFQFLHQGTDVVPCDFLLAAEDDDGLPEHQNLLIANCLAQSEALAFGRTREEAEALLTKSGLEASRAAALAPHKAFPGNRPSNTLLFRRLDPFTLGQLIALYEHKVFVQGAIWKINSFDQWGVELGKELATGLLPAVSGRGEPAQGGASAGLLGALKSLRREG